MLKKTITYTDYNGETRTEDFYFNLSKAEIIDMEQGTEGGLSATIKNLLDTKDIPGLSKLYRGLIEKSYGVKSDDGRRFSKSPDILRDFVETEAFSELYTELATNVDASNEFLMGVFPADLVSKIDNTTVNSVINAPKHSMYTGMIGAMNL